MIKSNLKLWFIFLSFSSLMYYYSTTKFTAIRNSHHKKNLKCPQIAYLSLIVYVQHVFQCSNTSHFYKITYCVMSLNLIKLPVLKYNWWLTWHTITTYNGMCTICLEFTLCFSPRENVTFRNYESKPNSMVLLIRKLWLRVPMCCHGIIMLVDYEDVPSQITWLYYDI